MTSVLDNDAMESTNRAASRVAAEPKLSEGDRRQRNQYLREFMPAMVGYGVILAGVLTFVDEDSDSAKFWILLPVLPMIAVAVSVYRSIRRADEFTRRIQTESMAVGFGAAVIASLVFAMLGVAGVASIWSGWIIFSVAMATWGVTVGLRVIAEERA